jgi:putative oxidoreductase
MDGHLWLIAGRTLIGLVFLWSGYDKIAAYGPTAGMMRAHAVPFTPIALPAAIVLELVCGVCMVAGFWVPWNALALVAFVVVASILIPVKDLATSDPRAKHQTQIQLAGNIQIVGGLLFIFGASI